MAKGLYDVVIVGGGVCGTATAFMLSKYTNVKDIALIEKYKNVGLVNSHHNHNSQTLHTGDVETHYTVEKARRVRDAANLVKNYVEKHKKEKGLFNKTGKIVLAVGKKQVEALKKRHEEFKKLFPKLKLIGPKEIAKLEPNILKGRKKDQPIIAEYTTEGYAINYGYLAKSFVKEAKKRNKQFELYVNTKLLKIEKNRGYYTVRTNKKTFHTKTIVVCAGAHSLIYAKQIGYGEEYGLLPVAGSFFGATRKLLNGKVYTFQVKKLPFSAIHGDPCVNKPSETRFGPTAKVLPFLERNDWKTLPDFIKTSVWSIGGILSLFGILSDWVVFKYVVRNFLYDMPIIGKPLFLQEVKKIVPSIKSEELIFWKGYGGIRPQIVNVAKRKMDLGEARIKGHNVIFNITPSPGASVCLKSAEKDVEDVIGFLGRGYKFSKRKMLKDLGKRK